MCVDVVPHKEFKTPVTLSQLKMDTDLQNMQFVKIGRLSVSEVRKNEFDKVCKMGGIAI